MANTQLTLFDLPTEPEQIGVLLPTARLRKVDFSALDYETARRAIIEYIQTYFPEQFNDFVASNGIMMMAEVVASNVAKLALRGDMIANEAFLPTASTEEAVMNHLALINQSIKRQTPATVDVEVSVAAPSSIDIRIPPGLVFQTRGPDNQSIYYELYRAPGDFISEVIIPAGKRGVIGLGLEGRTAGVVRLTSAGGPYQSFVIREELVLDDPISVRIGGVEWTVTKEPIEKFEPNDQIAQIKLFSERIELLFGNDVNGKAPTAGQDIQVRYRVGGGIRGRVQSNAINETRAIASSSSNSPIQVTFRNLVPSTGGTDRETLDQAKKRAPRDFAVRIFSSDRPASIVTASDYAQIASTFSHPVYGSVAKAVATIRTGLNANKVELYVLCDGPDGLVTPSLGLKLALATYVDELNVLTDHVEVLDGKIKTVDIQMSIVVSRNADATVVKSRTQTALDEFFSVPNRDLGQPLFTSDLIDAVMQVDGVAYVDLFAPRDNYLASQELGILDDQLVGIDEIIVEGNRDIQYFYEKL